MLAGKDWKDFQSCFFVVVVFEKLPAPRGFRVDSDLNLSPPSWLESWLNVLRYYFGTLQLQGTTPPMVRSQHTYGLPGLHNACVVQCIGSIPHDVIQHRKPTAVISIFPWRGISLKAVTHPSTDCPDVDSLLYSNRGNRCFNIVRPLALEFGLLRMVRQPSLDTHVI
jgi:hypothetical protein